MNASNADALDLSRPGIIEASAGTGKTYTVAQIYLALLRGENLREREDDARKEERPLLRAREILVVTFTELATAELRSRLQKKIREATQTEKLSPRVRAALRLADAEFDEAAITTIHGFCLSVIKEFNLISDGGAEIRRSLADDILRFATRWRARKIADGNDVFYDVAADKIKSVIEVMLKNPEIVPKKPEESDACANALYLAAKKAFPEWKDFRKNARDISYDEMLTILQDALLGDPALAGKIAERFKVAIVDEFQDVDPVQWDIFRRVFLLGGKPIFCVGDPKQAIYEFRGGDIRTYRKAREEILKVGGENLQRLYKNWRSEPEMIAAFNEIFAFDGKICEEINAGTAKSPRKISAKISGLLDYSPVQFPSENSADRKATDDVPAAVLKIMPPGTNKENEAKKIEKILVEDVADLILNRGVPAKDIAILVKKNEEAARYRAMLEKRGIATSTTERGNVYLEPIAAPLGDVLRAMLEPQNAAAFRRALLSPFFASSGFALLCEPEDSEKIGIVREHFAEARLRWNRHGFLAAFRELSRALGFSKNIAESPSAKRTATDVAHLTELIHETEHLRKLSPESLVEDYCAKLEPADSEDESEAVQLRADSDSDAVRILTVHKSKGLEFEIVFLPSLWNASMLAGKGNAFVKIECAEEKVGLVFASSTQKPDAFLSATAESAANNLACLFYVALTRAKRRLVLYHTPQIPGKSPNQKEWISYQRQLLAAAGAFPRNGAPTEKTLPHWEILDDATTPLPEKIFPTRIPGEKETAKPKPDLISPEIAEQRFASGDAALAKIRRDAEGVFSFSSIIQAAEVEESGLRENDETSADEVVPAVPANETEEFLGGVPAAPRSEKSFPRKVFSELPGGPEFGTIAHVVFEKTNFSTRENLPELADFAVKNLPKIQTYSEPERRRIRENFIALVEENLTFPLLENGFRLSDLAPGDAIGEMEFHFPLRRSKNLFEELAEVFKSWGGIYAETAARHWATADAKISVAGMMKGVVDLVFRANGKFYVLDWKTNFVASKNQNSLPENLTESALREEIIRHGYALQWAIYAVALRKFLKNSMGENYNHDRDFGGIVYLFVRWRAPFFDFKTLDSARLDALERALFDAPEA